MDRSTFNFKRNNQPNFFTKKGFTLVELLVVISIFIIISSITAFNYGDFRSNVSLQNLADDIALSVRKAQGYAIGVRGVESSFYNNYGIHFSIDNSPRGPISGSPKVFLMFSNPSNNWYDDPGAGAVCNDNTNECLELFTINRTDKIKDIQKDSSWCTTDECSVDVVFKRPNSQAYFCFKDTSSASCQTNVSSVSIKVSNGLTGNKEKTKIISIQNTGQISIQ